MKYWFIGVALVVSVINIVFGVIFWVWGEDEADLFIAIAVSAWAISVLLFYRARDRL